MQLKTIKDIDVKKKRILLRADYNVSIKDKLIADDTRIRHTLPTINYLIEHGAIVTIMAHLGRPKAQEAQFSLSPVAHHLSELLGKPVNFCPDIQTCAKDNISQIKMLENLRFFPGEEKNDPTFAQDLATLADIYVDDAFGASHRSHASIVGVARLLPSVAGLSFAKEVKTILKVIESPKRPLVVIVGGAKVTDKIQLLEKLIELADTILVGGGMANAFLAGASNTKHLIEKAERLHKSLLLPTDLVFENHEALDIGPSTCEIYGRSIKSAGTVIWNGPMGVFEKPQFAHGTDYIFHTLTQNLKAFTVVGGGDTLKAIKKQSHLDRIDHISTGGGAMLELIEKGTLPGIEALCYTL